MAKLHERVARLEVHKDMHASLIKELTKKVESATFYLKSVGYLVGVLVYHLIGGPYAQALGDFLGALH